MPALSWRDQQTGRDQDTAWAGDPDNGTGADQDTG